MSNSVDLDQTPRSLTFDLGLQSLLRSVRNFCVITVSKHVTLLVRRKEMLTFRGYLSSPLALSLALSLSLSLSRYLYMKACLVISGHILIGTKTVCVGGVGGGCVCVCEADKNQQCLKKSDLKLRVPYLSLCFGSDRVTPQNVLSGSTLCAIHSALETSAGSEMSYIF